jgi:gliding motility-associated protein GldL
MSAAYRSSHPLTGKDKFYQQIAPVITGVGASVVILGALFKIMHWNGAGPMLIVGLGTEALLFLLFAFAPAVTEPDWTIVHPELGIDAHGHAHKPTKKENPGGALKKLDDVISNALPPEIIDKIGAGFSQLNQTVSELGKITGAAAASEEYTANVRVASSTIQELSKSYSNTVVAFSELANSTTDAKEYHSQIQNITKNLSALNAVYELELQDINVHLKSLNKFYGSLSGALESLGEASKETQVIKNELGKLSGNLTSLNTVYGNILAAYKG